jgi:hypothetical protein
MLEPFGLVLGTLWVACRGRHALLVENLLLRQQLAVALRSRRRPRLTRRDRLVTPNAWIERTGRSYRTGRPSRSVTTLRVSLAS